MPEPDFLTLTDTELSALGLTTTAIADSIEEALARRAAGTLWTAPKCALEPGDGRYVMATLAAADDPALVVVKSVLLNPRNAARGLDTINGAIMVLDSDTGLLRCVMPANWVTAVRTAGLSAVAARRLADPDARVIAFVGSGVQARSHLDAFADMFPLAEMRVAGRGQANIDRLCAAARARGLTAQACATPRAALEEADIVVTSITATFEGAPFLDAEWLKPGAFAAITDMGRPWRPDSLDAFATVVIDDRAQEAAAPARMVPARLVTADLAEMAGNAVPVRFDPAQRSAFLFRGMAIGDFAVAALAYRRALATRS